MTSALKNSLCIFVQVLVSGYRLTKLFMPKLSDLNAMIAASGGRKARPYKRLAHPLGRGGVYPHKRSNKRFLAINLDLIVFD